MARATVCLMCARLVLWHMDASKNTNNLTVEQYLNAYSTHSTINHAFFTSVEICQEAWQLKATGK